MNQRQENKSNMYLVVIGVFNLYPIQLATIAALNALVTLFKGLNTALNGFRQQQLNATNGVASDKAFAKNAMAEYAAIVAGAVFAYADNQTPVNETLKAEVNYSKSDILGADDTEAEQIAQKIHDKANANLVALATYGITAPILTTLLGLITTYHNFIDDPQFAINDKEIATINIRDTMSAMDDMLKDRIDKLIPQFLIATPPNQLLVDRYFQAREIIDLGGVGTTSGDTGILSLNVFSSVGNTPIVNATGVVQGSGDSQTTDGNGNAVYDEVETGAQQILVSAPGFVSQTVSFNVIANQTTTLNVTLIPV